MNNIFRGCCLILPEELPSTPTFSESRKNSASSKTTMADTLLKQSQGDIMFIKPRPNSWKDDDEASIEEYSTLNTSMEVNLSHSSSGSQTRRRSKNNSARSRKVDLLDEHSQAEMLTWLCNPKCQNQLTRSSMYIAANNDTKRLSQDKLSPTGKILDWLMMCFWTCSPGCQQIPN